MQAFLNSYKEDFETFSDQSITQNVNNSFFICLLFSLCAEYPCHDENGILKGEICQSVYPEKTRMNLMAIHICLERHQNQY